MAARLNPRNQESVKQKIQASQLVNRLQKHALGEIEMTPTQVDSAKFLLNKRISNAPTEMNLGGQQDNPINANIAIENSKSWLSEILGNVATKKD